jgi:hypothetical protein
MTESVVIVYVVTLLAVGGYAYSVWSRQARLRRDADQYVGRDPKGFKNP